MTTAAENLQAALDGGLIVSCQPVTGGPMDNVATIVALALAARDGGARALRIEGAANVAAVARACDLPIVGLVKRDLDTSPVRITPFIEDVAALAEAGAQVIAVDATDRSRPVPVEDLLAAIRRHGRIAMADLSNEAEAARAKAMGFDILGTTMSGYTGGPVPAAPDLAFVAACRRLGGIVVALDRDGVEAVGQAVVRIDVARHLDQRRHCLGLQVRHLERPGRRAARRRHRHPGDHRR